MKQYFNNLFIKFLIICIALFTIPFIVPYPVYNEGIAKPTPEKETLQSQCGCNLSFANAVEKAAPSVVSMQTTKAMPIEAHPLYSDPFFQHFFDLDNYNLQQPIQRGLGSGVIVDSKNGYVLTNNHVIKDTTNIEVKLYDGRVVPAKIIGSDPQSDLAIIQINANNIPEVSIGESNKLRVGDIVLAIGNPFGLDQTVTQGIVSALAPLSSRTGDVSSKGSIFDKLIQTDADVNPGNSGGGLFDVSGNLIGINMAIVSKSGGSNGIGFAIPIDHAKEISQQLIKNGFVKRAWLGAHLKNMSTSFRRYINYDKPHGVYVQAIIRGGPGQKAGILPGDILLKINDEKLFTAAQAVNLISKVKPSSTVQLLILRNNKELSMTVALDERP